MDVGCFYISQGTCFEESKRFAEEGEAAPAAPSQEGNPLVKSERPADVHVKAEIQSPRPALAVRTPNSRKKQRLLEAGDTLQEEETQAYESLPTMRDDVAEGNNDLKGSPKSSDLKSSPKSSAEKASPNTSSHPKGSPKTTSHPEGPPKTTSHPEGSPKTTSHPEGSRKTTSHPEGSPKTSSSDLKSIPGANNEAPDLSTQTQPVQTPYKNAKKSPKSTGKRRRLCRSPVDKSAGQDRYLKGYLIIIVGC